jgi:tRNA threonylcarbamoyladenosine biosynthesis protein TsaE
MGCIPNGVMNRIVENVEEMNLLGREIAEGLKGGEVIALTGDLGAGKTHFCQSIVAALGARESVTSPTFTLVHEYPSGRLPVSHFDFYRADFPDEIVALGWDDYLDRGDVILVEWADKFPQLFPSNTKWIHLTVEGPTRRVVSLEEAL